MRTTRASRISGVRSQTPSLIVTAVEVVAPSTYPAPACGGSRLNRKTSRAGSMSASSRIGIRTSTTLVPAGKDTETPAS
ncbi:hypothetical protein [Candidatus Palauibacter sp.]|uniref:hypothetical protein n=1 Tax=Candidatus Palauibacter sp. TaxID=3101350 RepID=UPI003B022053